jgi:hypothetical protein
VVQLVSAQQDFSGYFNGDKLRLDYTIRGTKHGCSVSADSIYREANWGGSVINTIDTFLYGEMLLEVFDSVGNKLIYSRGYSSLFKEWQTTPEADSVEREFGGSVVMPFPEHPVRIDISERNYDLSFGKIFSLYINPDHSGMKEKVRFRTILYNGLPANKLDIVFLSEGYREDDSTKFFSDVRKKSDELFQWEPYSAYRSSFNIYAVFVPTERTTEDATENAVKPETAFGVKFNTFGSQRYLSAEHISKVRDAVSGIPYDQICIVVNSQKYGGGGIYNFLTLFTSDNEYSEFLFHHEFGHGFASLADEYYSSVVPYESLFDLNYEPYQPNITPRVDFSRKWHDLIPDTVPVPTPNIELYRSVTGLFEGAGYSPKGVYRPYYNCSMKSRSKNAFCPVCRRAIEQMIRFYTAE